MHKLHEHHTERRGQWERQIEFFLTLVGYAVGLGNVWRFPYLCFKNGGGAFLIPYLLCLILLGVPVFALEVSFGQFGGRGPVTVWYVNPAMKGVGLASVLISAIIQIYYAVIIAWGLFYLFASMSETLPWTECNTCACHLYNPKTFLAEADPRTPILDGGSSPHESYEEGFILQRIYNYTGLNCSNFTGHPRPPSELYFNKMVLQISGGIDEPGHIQWKLLLCAFLAWTVVFLVLCRGIRSMGKVVYFTATVPYLLLTVLLVRGALMEGAADGVRFYLTPDFEKLKDANVWSDAAVQTFFSLSACQGGLIAMSSYNRFHNNILREAFLVPLINAGTSIFAGFVVFTVLGHIALLEHTSVANVTQGGPGLAFVVYPDALAEMPVAPLWAILFFTLFCILGFSSLFSVVETAITSVFDEFPELFLAQKRQYLYRAAWCAFCFLLGIPFLTQGGSYLLDLVDNSILGFPSLVVGFCELIALGWIYGFGNISKDIEVMVGHRPLVFFPCWMVISPVLIIMVIISAAAQHHPRTEKGEPAWAEVLHWLIIVTPIVCIPVWFLAYVLPRGGWKGLHKLRELNKPKIEWLRRRLTKKSPSGKTLSPSGISLSPA